MNLSTGKIVNYDCWCGIRQPSLPPRRSPPGPHLRGGRRDRGVRARGDEPARGGAPRRVTHAAATYHFGDQAGLLTAVAAEGYRLLAEALRGAQETRGSFLEVGMAYVRFAVDPPGPFRGHVPAGALPPRRCRARARPAAAATLLYGTRRSPWSEWPGVAAWSIVHGLATLWLNGNLPAQLGTNPQEITRIVAPHLPVARN